MKNVLSNTITAVLVICAVIVTVSVVRQAFYPQPAVQAAKNIPDWQSLVAGKAPAMGRAGAPIVVVEFSDYQCPFCRTLEPGLTALSKKYPSRLVVYRYDFPLTQIHDHAYQAAIASRCAEKQGAYKAFSERMFQVDFKHPVDWSEEAKLAGIADRAQFMTCLQNKQTAGVVDEERAKALALGIQGTPTLVVNGRVYAGSKSLLEIEKLASKATLPKKT